MTLSRRYASATLARRLARALEADHPADLEWSVRGTQVEFRFSAGAAESARATADDLLACLSAAERTAEVTETRRTAPGRPRRAAR